MSHANMPPPDLLAEFFEYDKQTETLYRKKPPVRHTRTQGYPAVYFKGKSYYAHRLVWVLVNGPIPKGYEIDHIDRNPLNYRLSNLRLVTRSQNSFNRYLPLKHEAQNIIHNKRYNRWEVRTHIRGKRLYIGYFKTETEAIAARDKAFAERNALYGVVH